MCYLCVCTCAWCVHAGTHMSWYASESQRMTLWGLFSLWTLLWVPGSVELKLSLLVLWIPLPAEPSLTLTLCVVFSLQIATPFIPVLKIMGCIKRLKKLDYQSNLQLFCFYKETNEQKLWVKKKTSLQNKTPSCYTWKLGVTRGVRAHKTLCTPACGSMFS